MDSKWHILTFDSYRKVSVASHDRPALPLEGGRGEGIMLTLPRDREFERRSRVVKLQCFMYRLCFSEISPSSRNFVLPRHAIHLCEINAVHLDIRNCNAPHIISCPTRLGSMCLCAKVLIEVRLTPKCLGCETSLPLLPDRFAACPKATVSMHSLVSGRSSRVIADRIAVACLTAVVADPIRALHMMMGRGPVLLTLFVSLPVARYP